jgi:hypothetical protein
MAVTIEGAAERVEEQRPSSLLPAPSTLLVGDTGSGKTHSIRTFLESGVTPFVLFTEPGMEVFGPHGEFPDVLCAGDASKAIHWHYVPAAREDWTTIISNARDVNTLPMDVLAKRPDMQKGKYAQLMEVLVSFQNFQCQGCGNAFGDVTEWGPERALVLDSLSGLNIIAMDNVAGGKPVKSVQNWGVAMDGIERLMNKLCLDTRCFFVCTAHLEKEVDELTGVTTLTASTLGRRLAPKLLRFFSDVVQCTRSGKKFAWATATINTSTKARNLGWETSLEPSFAPIVASFRSGATKPLEHVKHAG